MEEILISQINLTMEKYILKEENEARIISRETAVTRGFPLRERALYETLSRAGPYEA